MRSAPIVSLMTCLALVTGACSRPEAAQTSDRSESSGSDETSSARGSTASGPGRSVASFETFGDCDGLLAWTKQRLTERVTPYGVDAYGWAPGEWASAADAPAADDAEAPAATEAPAAESSFNPVPEPVATGGTSTTNTQEAGVDEGDVSETDGRYVYSILDGVLRSVDLQTSTLVSEELFDLPLGGSSPEMIVFGETLLVVWTEWQSQYGQTAIRRFQLTAGVPTSMGTTVLEGTPISVRSVNGLARITMGTSLLPRIKFVSPLYNSTTDNVDAEEKAVELNKQIIDQLTTKDLLPRSFERDENGAQGAVEQALDCGIVGHPGEFSGFGLTWVATVDLNQPGDEPAGSGGVIADGQTVYVSPEHLYLAGQTGLWPEIVDGVALARSGEVTTAIHAFDISDPSKTVYQASGEVSGNLLSSYSMSEFGGVLRVATTTISADFGSPAGASVHVLRGDQGVLGEIGAVSGFGLGEQIQAVRFFGEVGYVVTFRQTDPLFVLDLSDPWKPTLAGELKIPGYSSYLHPVGDGLLLGVGFVGTESGLSGGTEMSLFDVKDPAKPTLIARTALGDVTEAAFDPHAFLWWPETGDVIVPKEMNCQIGDRQECSTAVVVHVDLANRTMAETGRLFQWFPIRRSMVANGDLITISAGGLKQWSFADLAEKADIRFDIPNTDFELTLP